MPGGIQELPREWFGVNGQSGTRGAARHDRSASYCGEIVTWAGQVPARPGRGGRRGAALTASGAALVLGAGVIIVAFGSPGSHASLVSSEGPENATKPLQPAASLQLVSMTPAAGAKGVNGTSPIRVQFSAPLAPNSPMPALSPSIPGHWAVQGDAAVFTPAVGWSQKTKVTVKIPGGLAGVVSAEGATAGDGGTLGANLRQSFTTGSFSTVRLQQLLVRLGYLPMTWTATSGPAIGAGNARAQLAAAYRAPAGTFTWQSGWPWTLRKQWTAGSGNILDVGAIRAFESVHGMTMDGIAGAWAASSCPGTRPRRLTATSPTAAWSR